MVKKILSGLFLVALLIFAAWPQPVSASSGSNQFKLKGTIQSLPEGSLVGDWVVNGYIVHVSSSTIIKQEVPAAIGRQVEVKGFSQQDGSINATKIEVKAEKFYGTVQMLPANTLIGNWTVNNRIVNVTAQTQIIQKKGAVQVGVYVEVKGYSETDGSFTATRIEVKKALSATKTRVKTQPSPSQTPQSPATQPSSSGNSSKFYGYIEALPDGLIGNWTISGRTVRVTSGTKIEQKHGAGVQVGAYVEVKGYQESDGSFTATKIEVKQ